MRAISPKHRVFLSFITPLSPLKLRGEILEELICYSWTLQKARGTQVARAEKALSVLNARLPGSLKPCSYLDSTPASIVL